MRVQLTIRDSIWDEVKRRAGATGITASRLVEEYLARGLRSETTGVTLTTAVTESVPRLRDNASAALTPRSDPTQQRVTRPHGSQGTTSQPKLGDLTMDDIFEPEPARPVKPLGEMTDEELDDATDDAVPLHR